MIFHQGYLPDLQPMDPPVLHSDGERAYELRCKVEDDALLFIEALGDLRDERNIEWVADLIIIQSKSQFSEMEALVWVASLQKHLNARIDAYVAQRVEAERE